MKKTIEADGTVKEYCFLLGGAVYKTTNGVGELLFTYTDHLSSITHITDDEGKLLAEQSFGAWGRMRDPDTWEYTIVNNQSSIINGRGYTGHEMLPKFGIINMNGRLYDPILGRMLSPDNYVQAPDFTQNFNRYSYVLNNPLKYTDPSGDKWWHWGIADILTGGTVSILGSSTIIGGSSIIAPFSKKSYELQKYISPVPFHPVIHTGSDQFGIGFDISVGVTKSSMTSYRKHYGKTYYWNNFGEQSGVETRSGAEVTILGSFNFSGTKYSGNTWGSQTTNKASFGIPGHSVSYENDFMFGLSVPGVPEADTYDRYRSAAVEIEFGGIFSMGVNFFTGDPGKVDIGERPSTGGKNRFSYYDLIHNITTGHDTYEAQKGSNPDQYRAGIGYVGIGQFKLGRNSEKIRHYGQNVFAHDIGTGGDAKWFKVLDIKPKWYWYFGTGTGNSSW